MFKRTYGVIYEQNAYLFTDLFKELENYYARGTVSHQTNTHRSRYHRGELNECILPHSLYLHVLCVPCTIFEFSGPLRRVRSGSLFP